MEDYNYIPTNLRVEPFFLSSCGNDKPAEEKVIDSKNVVIKADTTDKDTIKFCLENLFHRLKIMVQILQIALLKKLRLKNFNHLSCLTHEPL